MYSKKDFELVPIGINKSNWCAWHGNTKKTVFNCECITWWSGTKQWCSSCMVEHNNGLNKINWELESIIKDNK